MRRLGPEPSEKATPRPNSLRSAYCRRSLRRLRLGPRLDCVLQLWKEALSVLSRNSSKGCAAGPDLGAASIAAEREVAGASEQGSYREEVPLPWSLSFRFELKTQISTQARAFLGRVHGLWFGIPQSSPEAVPKHGPPMLSPQRPRGQLTCPSNILVLLSVKCKPPCVLTLGALWSIGRLFHMTCCR